MYIVNKYFFFRPYTTLHTFSVAVVAPVGPFFPLFQWQWLLLSAHSSLFFSGSGCSCWPILPSFSVTVVAPVGPFFPLFQWQWLLLFTHSSLFFSGSGCSCWPILPSFSVAVVAPVGPFFPLFYIVFSISLNIHFNIMKPILNNTLKRQLDLVT